ncbi:hypothetical protein PAAG_04994 [Paracoccidioides lutzii Pb01]|uniref:Uncharacterized protein n=1 Tax=Paracoccidioides lutzii (strain ATCC MYA-826 / Pb01) TaxID=502779 RepID=C1H2K1_PARBA|nr:hypothetical protein PAAG_04994 [Paracoccidioides lutzii Pb01]EEH33945.2 hypothetical protein PAAG_04994 [Paracoccidioides lutzii Pb01]
MGTRGRVLVPSSVARERVEPELEEQLSWGKRLRRRAELKLEPLGPDDDDPSEGLSPVACRRLTNKQPWDNLQNIQ